MNRTITAIAVVSALAACSPTSTQQAQSQAVTTTQNAANTVNLGFQVGQLFCGLATQLGPVVVGVVDAANGQPVSVVGKASDRIASVCQQVGGIPVVTPSNPTAVPVVAVPAATALNGVRQ